MEGSFYGVNWGRPRATYEWTNLVVSLNMKKKFEIEPWQIPKSKLETYKHMGQEVLRELQYLPRYQKGVHNPCQIPMSWNPER